jgi:hypothetical protein
MHARYLAPAVVEALTRKTAFVGGPRQVGKTTFALSFLGRGASGGAAMRRFILGTLAALTVIACDDNPTNPTVQAT